jgi:hypothetical protein
MKAEEAAEVEAEVVDVAAAEAGTEAAVEEEAVYVTHSKRANATEATRADLAIKSRSFFKFKLIAKMCGTPPDF